MFLFFFFPEKFTIIHSYYLMKMLFFYNQDTYTQMQMKKYYQLQLKMDNKRISISSF